MSDRTVMRWLGVGLSAIGVVATLWLAATGRLTLYIHPRYVVFTTVMAVIGGALIVAAILFSTRRADDHRHDDDHGHEHGSASPARRRFTVLGGLALATAATVALLALPPASLSTGALSAAEIDTTTSQTLDDAPELVGGDSSTFTVKDWAALLRQGLTAGDLTGMQAHVIGFVAPDPGGSEDLFYLARFSVTCCAVDAQPIAIPVQSARWADDIDEGGWVRVAGSYVDGPGPDAPTVLQATTLEPIDEPTEPYVF